MPPAIGSHPHHLLPPPVVLHPRPRLSSLACDSFPPFHLRHGCQKSKPAAGFWPASGTTEVSGLCFPQSYFSVSRELQDLGSTSPTTRRLRPRPMRSKLLSLGNLPADCSRVACSIVVRGVHLRRFSSWVCTPRDAVCLTAVQFGGDTLQFGRAACSSVAQAQP